MPTYREPDCQDEGTHPPLPLSCWVLSFLCKSTSHFGLRRARAEVNTNEAWSVPSCLTVRLFGMLLVDGFVNAATAETWVTLNFKSAEGQYAQKNHNRSDTLLHCLCG